MNRNEIIQNIRFKSKYGLMLDNLYQHYLFEGLTKSYNILELEKTLYSLYKKDIKWIYTNESEYDTREFPEKIRIIVDKRISIETFKNLINTCFNLYGWIFIMAIPILMNNKRYSDIDYDYHNKCLFLKDFNKLSKSKFNYIELQFEAKFSKEILNFPNNTILYHTTYKKYLNKIIQNGLIPKSSNKFIYQNIKENDIDRVYFSTSFLESIDSINATINNKNDSLILLRISSKNLLLLFNNYKENIHFFEDIRMLHGLFTYNNIHPKYIDLYIENDFNDKQKIYNDNNWINLTQL